MSGIKILGTGSCVPSRRVTNEELCRNIESDPEWIMTRTGIKERRFADASTYNYMQAASAAKEAINKAIDKHQIDISQIRYCIVATFTPDYASPSVACMVQKELGLSDTCTCFDVNGACSGFLYGLHIARGLLMGETDGYALVIGSEIISKRLDMSDRETCILFGDGAGAVLIQKDKTRLYVHETGSRGEREILGCGDGDLDKIPKVWMQGKAVYRFAVGTVPGVLDRLLVKAGYTMDQIDRIVCHQANARIVEHIRRVYKESMDKFPMNISEYGNTSAASLPILLAQMDEEGTLVEGERIICVGFGAGLTWAAILLEV